MLDLPHEEGEILVEAGRAGIQVAPLNLIYTCIEFEHLQM